MTDHQQTPTPAPAPARPVSPVPVSMPTPVRTVPTTPQDVPTTLIVKPTEPKPTPTLVAPAPMAAPVAAPTATPRAVPTAVPSVPPMAAPTPQAVSAPQAPATPVETMPPAPATVAPQPVTLPATPEPRSTPTLEKPTPVMQPPEPLEARPGSLTNLVPPEVQPPEADSVGSPKPAFPFGRLGKKSTKVQAEKTNSKGVSAFGSPGSKTPKVPAKRTVARPTSAAPGLRLPAFLTRNQKKPAARDNSEAVLVTEPAPKQAQGSKKRLALIGLSAAVLLGAALVGKTFLMPADPAVLATFPADATSPTQVPAATTGKPGGTSTSLATPAAAASTAGKSSSAVPKKSTPTTVPSGTAAPDAAHATEPVVDPNSTGVTDALVQPDPALSATFGKTTGGAIATSDASPRPTPVAVQTVPSSRLVVQRTPVVPRVTDQAAVSVPVAFGQAPVSLPSAPLPVQQVQRVTAPPITLPQNRYVPPAVMTGAVPLPVTPLPAPQSQGSSARAAVTYLAPGVTPRTTTNGAVSGPLTLTRPGEAPITLTQAGDASQATRYLGYSETDAGRVAIVHLEGRDETVSAGQVIPGTSVKVMAVTPASLTLKNDGKTAVIPIEVSQ